MLNSVLRLCPKIPSVRLTTNVRLLSNCGVVLIVRGVVVLDPGYDDIPFCADCEEVTDPTDYGELATELGRVGYSLRVVSKSCMGDAEYRTQRIQQL